MTDTKPTPAPAADTAKDDAEAAAADAAAKREGFADAAAKVAATKAAAAKPRKPRAPAKPQLDAAASIAKLKAGAAEVINAAVEKGDELTVALGNERGPAKVIEPLPAPLEPNPVRRGGKWQVSRPIVHNTHTLPRTTQFTHVWLMNGQRPLDVNELGSPVGLNPGQQLEFKRGQLTFG